MSSDDWGGGIFESDPEKETNKTDAKPKSLLDSFKQKFGQIDNKPPRDTGFTGIITPGRDNPSEKDEILQKSVDRSRKFDQLLEVLGKKSTFEQGSLVFSTMDIPMRDDNGNLTGEISRVRLVEGFNPVQMSINLDGNRRTGFWKVAMSHYVQVNGERRPNIIFSYIPSDNDPPLAVTDITVMPTIHIPDTPCPPGCTFIPRVGNADGILDEMIRLNIVRSLGLSFEFEGREIMIVSFLPPYDTINNYTL